MEVYGWQEQKRESSFPLGVAESPQTNLVPKGQRKRDPSQDGEKEADELRVDRKRRTRTEETTSQRAFTKTRTARGHILL